MNSTFLRHCMAAGMLVLFTLGSRTFAQAPDLSIFNGMGVPAPPQQAQPWTPPPSALTPQIVEGITALFNEGLADPRGCEYREVKVAFGQNGRNDYSRTPPTTGKVTAHGWLLPGDDAQKFAICWNGLVYPVISVGEKADSRKDMEDLLAKGRAQLDAEASKVSTSFGAMRRNQINDEFENPHVLGLVPDRVEPLQAALLLRLGMTGVAEKVWSQYWEGVETNSGEDPYRLLNQDYVFTLFDMGIRAHQAGDDNEAFRCFQTLTVLRPKIEAEAARRHLPTPGDFIHEGEPKLRTFLPFLADLPALLTDSQRRVAEGSYVPVSKMISPPQGKERIALLIRDLERVYAPTPVMDVYSPATFSRDPIILDLAAQGEEAVDPLIDCLENDRRLTRTMGGYDGVEVVRVNKAAYHALTQIFHTTEFGGPRHPDLYFATPEGNKVLADAIRAYAQRYKGKSPMEAVYEVLADDSADPRQWLKAASDIIQKSNVTSSPNSMFGEGSFRIKPLEPGEVVPMSGEPLRGKSNPSVSDLLLKRLQGFEGTTRYVDICHLAQALAEWDGKAHLSDLEAASELLQNKNVVQNQFDSLHGPVAALYEKRMELGDPQAAAEYAAWVVTLPRSDLDFSDPPIFQAMWRHPNDTAIRQAAEMLFATPGSVWVPLLGKNCYFVSILFDSPLVGMAAFRTELLRGLSDKSVIGSAKLESNGFTVNVNDGWSAGGESSYGDPWAPAAGSSISLRVCDLYAYEISRLDGAPNCRPYWPESKRDEGVKSCAAFLQKYGDLFQYQPGDSDENTPFIMAQIHYPQLDHSATPEDVAQNRAIFSLSGEHRIWKMPAFPMKASWTTLKEKSGQGTEIDGKGHEQKATPVFYLNEGLIWQAEEELVNGKWERFYGFVGPYHIAKVPASEIKLADPALP